jgi:Beta propeller domain
VDLSQPGAALRSRCFVGGSEALYMATDALYLATTRYAYTQVDQGSGGIVAQSYPPQISTDIHKFGFDGSQLRYLASGSVAGHLGWDSARKSYRLSEHEGLLRVLSFTGEFGWASVDDATTRPPSPATLTVLREDASAGKLVVVATLPNSRRPEPLGHAGEQVHGVRFIGARGYLVTFRRTDPLWVLDLADPADPQVAGELQVPGFSDQLYPLDGGMLLGVGRDADARGVVTGLKVSLFDVADAARPTERATLSFGGPGSMSALDTSPHGLNYLGVDKLVRAALPVLLTPPNGTSFTTWQHGLQRFEVDLAARTLVTRPMVAPPKDLGTYSVWDERSIQIGEHLYYLAGGELAAQPW